MTADADESAAGLTSVGALILALVILAVVILVVLVVDRSRTRRRLATLERSEAFLETDLADARREILALRECLQQRATLGERTLSSGTGEPTALT